MALSPREAEVLAGVRRRRTNAEIAAELFISVRTVETHVSSLLRKLQAADRRELASRVLPPEAETTGTPALVGRDEDLAALRNLLSSAGLVTVLGPGGVGKTSLVRWLGGAVVVDLTALPAGSGAALAATGALAALDHAVPEGQTALEALTLEVGRRQVLLILDNCEHVLEAAAALAGALVASPGVRVVATSRERLGVVGERLLRLEPLDPDAALELFTRRAADLEPPVTLGPDDLSLARTLCSRVDGLPLAVELAAARLGQLGTADLVEAVGAGIDVLDGGDRASSRHRSVRLMLDWSYHLLSPSDQRVHRRLSVLPGPFRIATANAVADDGANVAATVARLVDASLLVRVGQDRYRQLDLVRAHAAGCLADNGELETTVGSLLHWAVDLVAAGQGADDVAGLRAAAAAAEGLPSEQGVDLLRRLAQLWTEQCAWEDAMQTWERAARSSGDPRDALAAAEVALSRWRGDEAWQLFDLAATTAGDAVPAAVVRALEGQLELGARFPAAMRRAPETAVLQALLDRARAVDTEGDLASESLVACAEAWVCGVAGDHAGARDAGQRAAQIARAADEPVLESAAWDAVAAAAGNEGDADTVREVAERRLSLRGRLGGSPRADLELSDVETMAVDGSLAVGRFEEAHERAARLLVRERGRGLAHVGLGRLVTCEFHLGMFDEALAHAAEAIAAWEDHGGTAAGYLLAPVTACVAISGFMARDDDERRWLAVANRLRQGRGPATESPLLRALRADVHLFHGRVDRAVEEVRLSPWDVPGLHRSTYAAIRAAVLGGEAIEDAERMVLGNRYAAAVVARARGDLDEALGLFDACGAAFEVARTRVRMEPSDEARTALDAFLLVTPGSAD